MYLILFINQLIALEKNRMKTMHSQCFIIYSLKRKNNKRNHLRVPIL